MMKRFDMRDKCAIVTGASSGIGRASALGFSRQGARVVLASRNTERLRQIQQMIQEEGGTSLAIPADVTREEDLKNLIGRTLSAWGRVDIFLANAGEYVKGAVALTDMREFELSLAVNFFGALRAIQLALPSMVAQKSGVIVVMNSLDAIKGIVGDGPYVAAKKALDGVCEILRQELRGSGVRVLSVYPGRVDTPMVSDIRVPRISRKMAPETVARAVLRGIRKGKSRVFVPALFRPLELINALFPRFTDWAYYRLHLQGWKIEPDSGDGA